MSRTRNLAVDGLYFCARVFDDLAVRLSNGGVKIASACTAAADRIVDAAERLEGGAA